MTEIQNHRKFGADLDDGGKRRTGIEPASNRRKYGWRIGRYSVSLNDAENDRLEKFTTPRDF